MFLYVHRNRRLIRDRSPGRPPRLSHSSWALLEPVHGPMYVYIGPRLNPSASALSFPGLQSNGKPEIISWHPSHSIPPCLQKSVKNSPPQPTRICVHPFVLVLVVCDGPWSAGPLVSDSSYIVFYRYGRELYTDHLVQEQQTLLLSAFLERLQIKLRQHGCDTSRLPRRVVPLQSW